MRKEDILSLEISAGFLTAETITIKGGTLMVSRFSKILLALAMAFILITGCSVSQAPVTDDRGGVETPGAGGDSKDGGDFAPEEPDSGAVSITGDQKLIRNGSITLTAGNIETAQEEIRIIAARYNGYVYSLRQSQTSERRFLEVTIKVVTERFDAALEDIKGLGTTSNISMDVRDVTTEFIDTEARIETLKVKETTLTDILAKATRIEDILLIETSLQETRQEIESYEGRLNALRNATDYSTITINVTDTEGLAKTEDPVSPATRFQENLSRGLRYWTNAAIDAISGILFLLPVLIPLAVILILLLAVRRRRPSKKRPSGNALYTRHDRKKAPVSSNDPASAGSGDEPAGPEEPKR